MPLTSLIIKDKGTERYLQVSTEPNPDTKGVIVIFTEMNEDFTESKGSDQGVDAREENKRTGVMYIRLQEIHTVILQDPLVFL